MNRKIIKVAVINPFGGSLGHSALYATKICQSLMESGASVTLFTSMDYNPDSVISKSNVHYKVEYSSVGDTDKNKKNLKKISSVISYGYKNIRETLATLKYFESVNNIVKFDVVHMIGGETATNVIWGWWFKKFRSRFVNMKIYVTIHNADYSFQIYRNQSKIKGIYKLICRGIFSSYLLRTFDGVMVHGHQAKIDLEDQINKQEVSDKIFPINIGISKIQNKVKK